MFNGQVDFIAHLLDTGITFSPIQFNPPIAGIKSAEVEMQGLEKLVGTVHIELVAKIDDGMCLAHSAIESILNRLSFFHDMTIERARVTSSKFIPANLQPGQPAVIGTCHLHATGYPPKVTVGVSQALVQGEFEQTQLPGEENFGLFRSARLSVGPVEEFMHLYAILLDLINDKQRAVDKFIVSIEPGIQQTQDPRKSIVAMETLYTRLRNELAHKRPGAVVEVTKQEMSKHLPGLRAIARKAIIQYA